MGIVFNSTKQGCKVGLIDVKLGAILQNQSLSSSQDYSFALMPYSDLITPGCGAQSILNTIDKLAHGLL
jgi:hypothetical protein